MHVSDNSARNSSRVSLPVRAESRRSRLLEGCSELQFIERSCVLNGAVCEFRRWLPMPQGKSIRRFRSR